MKDNRTIEALFRNVQNAVSELEAKLIEEGEIEGGEVSAQTGGGNIPPGTGN